MQKLALALLLLLPAKYWAQNKVYNEKLSTNTAISYKALEADSNYRTGSYQLRYNNRIQVSGNYSKNLKHGAWKKLLPNGQKKAQGSYINNRMHGKWMFYYNSGKKKAICYYNLGKRVGNWEGYFPEGQLATKQMFHNDTLIEAVYFNQKTGKVCEQHYYNYQGSNLYRSEKLYHPKKGNIYKEAYYVNEVRDSIYQTYHENRAPWESLVYDNGLLMEIESIRNPAGEKMFKGNFFGGDGLAHFYDYDGFLYAKVNYAEGLKNGKARYYQRNNLMSEGSYINNQRTGVWKFYSEFGKLLEEINYIDSVNSQQIIYGYAWNEKEMGPLKNGLRHGVWKKFNFYGELEYEINYRFGYKHGEAKLYHPITLKAKGEYNFGEKTGKWEYFNTSGKVIYTENFISNVSLDTSLILANKNDPLFEKLTRYEKQTVFRDASFPGGKLAEEDFIASNLFYPKEAKANDVHGSVEVQFLVHPTGEIDQVRLVKGLGYGCDEEVIRVIEAMPWWEPAEENGIPIRSLVYRSIGF